MDSRTALIRIFTFLGGIYFFFHFIVPESALEAIGIKDAHPGISNGFIVIGAMAIGLGIINLVAGHGSHVLFKRRGWVFSAVLLFSLITTLGVTTAQWLRNRAVSNELQRIYVIGEFANRILSDASDAKSPKSFSPTGELPKLEFRVQALAKYARAVLEEVGRVSLESRGDTDQQSVALREDLHNHQNLLVTDLDTVETASWESLSGSNKRFLERLSKHSSGYATAFSVIRRRDAERGFIPKLYTVLYTGIFENLGAAMFALLGVYIAAAAFRAFRVRSMESTLMMVAALVVMLGQISFGKWIYNDMPALRQWLLEIPNSAVFRAIRFGAAVAGLMLAIRMWFSIESKTSSEER